MCTLIALLRVVPGYPLVVAMNRDEFLDRPSAPPELRDGTARIVAPRDERAEGTWIGVNEHGLVAALSNRIVGPPNLDARSRGLLCLESLRVRDAGEAAMLAANAPDAHPYNPFNLLHADPRQVICTSHEGSTWAHHGVVGANILTNAGLNGDDPRTERVRSLLAAGPYGDLAGAIAALRAVLRDHEDAGGRAICHHGEKTGTVSQTVVAVSRHGWEGNRLWYGDGPACRTDLRDHSRLFASGRSARP